MWTVPDEDWAQDLVQEHLLTTKAWQVKLQTKCSSLRQ